MEGPISHPAEEGHDATRLLDHLDDVAERTRAVIPVEASTIGDGSLQDLAATVAKCHDIGKATTWFQGHVIDEEPDGPTSHSLFGAYLGYYVLDRLGYDSEDCLTSFVALARHHNRLPGVDKYVEGVSYVEQRSDGNNKRQNDLIEQVDNVDEHRPEFAKSFVEDVTGGAGSWDEFASAVFEETLFDTVHEHVDVYSFGGDRSRPSDEFYDHLLQIWSGLVLADKTTAARITAGSLDGTQPSSRDLADHVEGLGRATYEDDRTKELDIARSDAREDVLGGVDRFLDAEESVATLTLPTGMGKTLTGLSAAFELRDVLDRERVIYALPFTSIIDQVADEVSEVFDTDARDDLLTIHHHLAETATELDDHADDDTDGDARLEEMVAETWRSGMTVTTFVQLFESLAGPGNSQSMKLPALYDSVIVLDEPQALPMDWWKLVRRLTDILTERYDATVVAMTATQPELFDERFELVDNVDRYFDLFERVEYDVHDSALAFDDTDSCLNHERASQLLLSGMEETDSALAVCNTIDSATALTEAVEERADVVDVGTQIEHQLGEGSVDVDDLVDRVLDAVGPDERALVHLTTRIRPRDRLCLIEATKRLTDRDVSVVAVSTQLIEAGVDISFDSVYRDIAPIDSVVQAAGRCNRSFESGLGTVTLWWLAPPEGTTMTPAQAVYDNNGVSTVSLTSKTLNEVGAGEGSIEERTMTREAVQYYYDQVADRNPGSPEYVEWVDDANADELGKLSLIGQRNAVDVVVCRTDADRALVEDIRDAWADFRYDDFDDLLQETKDITVSLPIYSQDSPEAGTVRQLPEIADTDVCVLDTEQYGSYFDETQGLAATEPSVDDRFL